MEHKKLVIVWLSVDKRAASDMAMLYARDSLLNGWWKEAEVILWGPTVEAAVTDEAVKTQVEIMQSVGVKILGCLACASQYGVVDELRAMGIEVYGMGERLTGYLAGGTPVIFI